MSKEYDPDIVSVVDEAGKEHMFEELDRIETDKGRYVAFRMTATSSFCRSRKKTVRPICPRSKTTMNSTRSVSCLKNG